MIGPGQVLAAWGLGRSGPRAPLEEPRLSVLFGLDPMVGWTHRLPVGVGRQPAIGNGIDVIVLEVVGPVAAGSGADVAVEIWRCAEIEGRA